MAPSVYVQLPLFALDKRCATCGVVKLADDFHRNRNTPDGRTSSCKACANARSRAWQAENRERAAVRGKAYRANHAAQLAEAKHAYYVAHKVESQAYHKRHYALHRDALLAQQRVYNATHREERRAAVERRRRRYRALPRDYAADGEKRCPGCYAVKPVSAFHRHRGTKDGYSRYCKSCAIARARAWYQENKAQRAQRNADYRCRNAERLMRYRLAYRRDKQAVIAARQRAYRAERREHFAAESRLYRRMNPAVVQAQSHRRRARERDALGSHTGEEWAGLCALYGHACVCCGAQGPLEADHVVPLSKGGRDDIGNIQPLCKPCNRRKSAQTIDYRPSRG